MAVKLGDATLYLSADPSKLNRQLSESKREVSGWGSALQGALIGVGLGAFNTLTNAASGALRGVAGFFTEAIGAGSDLAETTNKVSVLFGEGAAEILAWSNTAVSALGQSKTQALAAAANFAVFGQAAGLTGQDLSTFATDLTGLATDLASFNNTSTDQALEAIGAALRGESEPLRQYGILLNEAALKDEALRLGLIATGSEALTTGQKVLAAKSAIFEQSAFARDDFAETSSGFAGSLKTLEASWQTFKETVGGALTVAIQPTVNALAGFAETTLPALADSLSTNISEAVAFAGNEFTQFQTRYGPEFVAGLKLLWASFMTEQETGLAESRKSFIEWQVGLEVTVAAIGKGIGSALFRGFQEEFNGNWTSFLEWFDKQARLFTLFATPSGWGELLQQLFSGGWQGWQDESNLWQNGPQPPNNGQMPPMYQPPSYLPTPTPTPQPTPTIPPTPSPTPTLPGPTPTPMPPVLPSSIAITINGVAGDPLAVGAASRDGLLSALYMAGAA